jgi:hypothetical protein
MLRRRADEIEANEENVSHAAYVSQSADGEVEIWGWGDITDDGFIALLEKGKFTLLNGQG